MFDLINDYDFYKTQRTFDSLQIENQFSIELIRIERKNFALLFVLGSR